MFYNALKAGLTTAAALAILGGVFTNPANAGSADRRSHTPHPQALISIHPKATANEKADIVEACQFKADTPFQLYVGERNVYGQGEIVGCTQPPPDECHMLVDLERQTYLEDGSEYWETIAHKDAGWASCTGQIGKAVTAKLSGCQYYDPPDFEYQTVVTLTGLDSEGGNDTEFAASPIYETTCW
jgi:hypothetical protein